MTKALDPNPKAPLMVWMSINLNIYIYIYICIHFKIYAMPESSALQVDVQFCVWMYSGTPANVVHERLPIYNVSSPSDEGSTMVPKLL